MSLAWPGLGVGVLFVRYTVPPSTSHADCLEPDIPAELCAAIDGRQGNRLVGIRLQERIGDEPTEEVSERHGRENIRWKMLARFDPGPSGSDDRDVEADAGGVAHSIARVQGIEVDPGQPTGDGGRRRVAGQKA